jgi:hypothetical protein
MPAVAGIVVNGRVELDEELPNGTRVIVRPEGEESLTLDAESVRELVEAGKALDQGAGVPAAKVLKRLARRRVS